MEMLRDKIKGFERQLDRDDPATARRTRPSPTSCTAGPRSLMLTARRRRPARRAGARARSRVRDPAGGDPRLGRRRGVRRARARARGVGDDVKSFAASLALPYCGANCRLRRGAVAGRAGAGAVDRDDPAAPREPSPAPSACWCSPRPTRPATPPTWAPTSWRASARSRARRSLALCRRPDARGRDREGSGSTAGDATPTSPRHLAAPCRSSAVSPRARCRSTAKRSTACRRFARAAGVPLRQAEMHHIRRWAAQLHGAGLAPRSIALALSAWRGLYRWLGGEGLVAANPVEGVRAPRAAQPLPKALSVDDAVALVGASRRGRLAGAGGARCAASPSCSTAAACASASWSASTSSPLPGRPAGSTLPMPAPTSSARAASGAACRSASPRSRRSRRGWRSAASRAPGREPALFVSRRGTRLTAEPGALAPEGAGARRRLADARPSAHAAPLVRLACAAVERRPARGAGAARPRQHHDHAGLHQARLRPSLEGVRRRPSAGAAQVAATGGSAQRDAANRRVGRVPGPLGLGTGCAALPRLGPARERLLESGEGPAAGRLGDELLAGRRVRRRTSAAGAASGCRARAATTRPAAARLGGLERRFELDAVRKRRLRGIAPTLGAAAISATRRLERISSTFAAGSSPITVAPLSAGLASAACRKRSARVPHRACRCGPGPRHARSRPSARRARPRRPAPAHRALRPSVRGEPASRAAGRAGIRRSGSCPRRRARPGARLGQGQLAAAPGQRREPEEVAVVAVPVEALREPCGIERRLLPRLRGDRRPR